MWSAPIHNQEFVAQMLEHVEKNPDDFKTAARITGMLTVARTVRVLLLWLEGATADDRVAQELADSPFYFTPGKLCGVFHCIPPAITIVAYFLLFLSTSPAR